jgi:hypothetical protein
MAVRPARWERQRYWQGQLLRSRDLNDQLTAEAQLRWWHNRALHMSNDLSNAYGVVRGLTVTGQGAPLTAVVIEPGLAYDCFGRELLLATAMTVPLRPAVLAGNWTLLATYPESNARSKHLDGGCLPAQLTPGSGIRIVWQPGLRYSTRDGVALAYLKGGQLESISTWRYGQALAGPRLGHGATPAGGTPWSEWRLEGVLNSRGTELILLGLQVTIDTSAAGWG